MKNKQCIPKTKHIHKIIPSLLFTVALLLCTALISPLTVHADYSSTQVEAEHSDGVYTSSNGYWYATYCPEAGYKGQGVLLYLLERNGGGPVAGTSPKAYPCSATMLSYELHAQDKYNRYPEVTTWEPTPVYWKDGAGKAQGGGFIKDSITSNTEAIKAWLKTPTGATTQGINMVKTIWGYDIAERFTNEEIILIAEPIVAVQFSQYYNTELLNITEDTLIVHMIAQLSEFRGLVISAPHTTMSGDLLRKIGSDIQTLISISQGKVTGSAASNAVHGIVTDYEKFNINSNIYWPMGTTYAGTSKMVASYYASLSPDQSVMNSAYSGQWKKSDSGRAYYRRSTSASAVVMQGSIICANANFNLWNRPKEDARQIHSDFNLQTYSIGMLAMLAFTEDGGQTTCNERLIPTPHEAPDESDGVYTIIKSYRTRNTETNTLTDDGTYPFNNVTNTIIIENEGLDEGCYQVIAWKTSTENITNPANFSVTWESSVPGIIGEQGDTITQVELPPSHKYLYVLLEKPDTPHQQPPTVPVRNIVTIVHLIVLFKINN